MKLPRHSRHPRYPVAILCLVSALLALSTFATEQEPDALIYQGQTNDLYAAPLESYFTADNPKPRTLRPVSTACHRGYKATWQIVDKQLQLLALNECHTAKPLPMTRFFPKRKGGGPFDASWFTGVIRAGSGEQIHEVGSHRNQREHEWYFQVEAGKVVKVTRQNPMQLKVVAHNIKHGRGMDNRVDLERIATVLKQTGADLIALQEVDKVCTRSGKIDIAQELGSALGMTNHFGAFMDFQGGEYGLAILSRFPVIKSVRHQLPEGAEPRCALEVVVLPPNMVPMSFVSIHNDWTDDAIRVKQVRAMITALEDSPRPVILAGDFNAKPGAASMKLVADAGWQILKKDGGRLTYPSGTPSVEIDYVAVRGLENPLIEHRVIDERIASDHRPIMALLRPRWRDK